MDKNKKKTPLQVFFELGNKATGGDPVKKSQFDYAFMWILFLAFILLSVRNWILFFQTWEVGYLPWALIGLAISWFQYHALKQFYHVKENMKKLHSDSLKSKPQPIVEESVDEMLEEFKSQEVKNGSYTKL